MAKNINSDDTRKRNAAPSADDATIVRPAAGASTTAILTMEPATVLFAISLEHGGELTWSSDIPVVSMLADLVAASSGSAESDGPEGLLSATAQSSLQAVILASRAQKLADAYSQHPGAQLRGLSIAVYSPSKNAVSDESALRTYLKASNRSGQVLLAGGTYKQLESLPGFQIRKVPVSAGQRLELHELVLPTVDRAAQTAARTRVSPQTATRTGVSEPKPFDPLREARTTILQTGQTAQVHALAHRKDDAGAAGGQKKMIAIGAIAAVLLVGAGIGVKMMSGGSHPAAPAAATPASTPAPSTETPAPAPKAAEPAAPVATMHEKKAAPAPRAAAPKPAADLPDAPQPQPTAAREPAQRSTGEYSADQIRAILDRADTLAGNGKYDEAIRNYNVVLQHDPGNSRAREGRARAIANKSM